MPSQTVDLPLPADDWPYLYLRERGIPTLYLTTLMVMACFAFGAIAMLSPLRVGTIDLPLFLLGASFLLLETKSVTTFSLLFGSTWFVNTVVFAAILAVVLLANWLVTWKRWTNPHGFFAVLLVTLGLLYYVRIAGFLRLGLLAKCLVAGGFVAAPIFFSSVIFAILVTRTTDIGLALGSNLLGAVTGGFLEYTSMLWGLNGLYLIAAALYLVANLRLMRQRVVSSP